MDLQTLILFVAIFSHIPYRAYDGGTLIWPKHRDSRQTFHDERRQSTKRRICLLREMIFRGGSNLNEFYEESGAR